MLASESEACSPCDTLLRHPAHLCVSPVVPSFTNWSIYGRKYHPLKVPYQQLSHILYAFADVREDGSVFLTDSWSDCEVGCTCGEDGAEEHLCASWQTDMPLRCIAAIRFTMMETHGTTKARISTAISSSEYARSKCRPSEELILRFLPIMQIPPPQAAKSTSKIIALHWRLDLFVTFCGCSITAGSHQLRAKCNENSGRRWT